DGGSPARPSLQLPPRRTLIGLVLLIAGGFMAFTAWSEGRSSDAIAMGGHEVTAGILCALSLPRHHADAPSHAVQRAWKDSTVGIRHFGPTHVSEGFWKKITGPDGQLTVKQTAIRYRDDDPQARPLIVDDAPEQQWQTQFGMGAGL